MVDQNRVKDRFSLLLLDPNEIYFEDFISTLNDSTMGRLKMCSKSLVFEPKNSTSPLIKIPFADITSICPYQQYSKKPRENEDNILVIRTVQFIEMLSGNVIAPYVFKGADDFLFHIHYRSVEYCIAHMKQLQRASTLPPSEHQSMIATIVHSRHSRYKFQELMPRIDEKLYLECTVDKISPLVVNPGRLVVSNYNLYFQSYNNVEIPAILKVDIQNIKRVIPRRFLLRHVGLEIHFLNDSLKKEFIYVAFHSPSDRKKALDLISKHPLLSVEELHQDTLTLQWQNGIISNYDYLMHLNCLADRTFHDLTQYPVFPWVLIDFSSPSIDLNDEKIYRDLSKPMGTLNPTRLKRLLERYNEMTSEPKFLYGSHYSAPALVIFYIFRKYPQYMLCLQTGRFDHPDRMFNSIYDTFQNCLNNMSDFKELVPEFYDTETKGDFLINSKNIYFGVRSRGSIVSDVELPPWATNAEHFVKIMRDALESEYVSKNLNHWIDLIFGYKQRGKEAENAHNVFYPLCYEGAIDLDCVSDVSKRHAYEVQIMEFGQIPKQLFNVPHPRRRPISIPLPLSELKHSNSNLINEFSILKLEAIAKYPAHKAEIMDITISDDSDTVYSVGQDNFFKMFSISQKKQLRSTNVGKLLASCLPMSDKNTILMGCFDDDIIFYDIECGRISSVFKAHDSVVSALTMSSKTNLIASCSWDATVNIYKNFETYRENYPQIHNNLVCVFDHDCEVTCIAFDSDCKTLISGTDDGQVCLWDIELHDLITKLQNHLGRVTSVKFSPDGDKIVSCGSDGIFRVFDAHTRMMLFERKVEDGKLCSMIWDWSGKFLILGTNVGNILIWDLVEVKLISTIQAHTGPVQCLVMSPNGEFLVSGSPANFIQVWSISKG